MAYRFYDPAPVYMDIDGVTPCAGGKLYTYAAGGTTTPKQTWSDEAQTTPNANPITLDSAGRANTNIWGDGPYTQELKAADGRRVWVREVTGGIPAGASIPALETGRFLTNDGSNLLWDEVRQVPDPTDSAGYTLGTDGANLLWIPPTEIPEPPAPDWDVDGQVLVIGGLSIQTGGATIPSSANYVSNVSITFPRPFTELFHVGPVSGIVSVGSFGAGVTLSVTGYTPGMAASGCTINANCTDDGGDGRAIAAPVPVTWVAIGKVAA